MATQATGILMPLKKQMPVVECRPITAKEKEFQAYVTLRKARTVARFLGIRAKRTKENSDNPEEPKAAKETKKSKK